ncbi:PREDICTED: exocyst complex component EXO70A1-like [Ipomoea nil]|uniref:exocyst complex component EXO70A1-like n=1 Tax=Ipomoea nil TaxID=35883 RepID=UPI000901F7DB|nr:PREDICTED: exocyst complex component EXO70A1-like [Ipomoea nil]
MAVNREEILKERAAFIRDSLHKSQTIIETVTAMRPTQIQRHSIRKAHKNLDKTLQATQLILSQFDLARQAEAKTLRGPHENLESYLEDQLRGVIKRFDSDNNFKGGVLNKYVGKLEEDLRQLLSAYSKPVEPGLFDGLPQSLRPSPDAGLKQQQQKSLGTAVYHPPALVPPRVQAGHHQEVFNIYRDIRVSSVEQSLRKLGVERVSKEDVQKMQWEVFEAKIGNWIHYMRIAMDIIFGRKYCTEMREATMILTKCLAETSQETFVDFEDAVEKDATKTTVHDGTIHPLTIYVINYVKFLFDYHSTLKLLFREFDHTDADIQMASITTRSIQALITNLDGKSKQYKDAALTQLFMMNNIYYIVRFVRRSEVKDLLGDDWVQIHRRIVQQHANQYKRISWSKILQCLSIQGVTPENSSFIICSPHVTSNVSRVTVKDRYKTFNVLFEELHQRQSQWTVPDSELRESLRLAVAQLLLPAYRSFIKHYGPMIENGKNPSKYIRFTPEDLERKLSEFFEGKTWNEQRR